MVTVLSEIKLRSMRIFGVMESHKEKSELSPSCEVFGLSWCGFAFYVDWMVGNPHLEFAAIFYLQANRPFFVLVNLISHCVWILFF